MLGIVSFGYKHHPGFSDASLEVDCRMLRNPWANKRLRDLDGNHPDVHDYVTEDPKFRPLINTTVAHIVGHTEYDHRHSTDVEKHLYLVAVACLGGKHRSVVVANTLFGHFRRMGWMVSGQHHSLKMQDIGPVTGL